MVTEEQTLVAKVHYPQDSVAINASNTGLAGASLAVSLAAAVNRYTYLAKAIVTSGAPAVLQVGVVTISDGTWTMYFQFCETVTAGGFAHLDFSDAPLVGSAWNTPITVTIPVIAGGAVTAIAAVGYQR